MLLAQACGALIGLATLAVAGAVGDGVRLRLGDRRARRRVLVGTLAGWAKLGPAWALLPIGALVLPSAALAVGGVRVEPTTQSVTVAPEDGRPARATRAGSAC